MTEREKLLYDLGKFAVLDKEIYADMKANPGTPIGEQLKAHVLQIGEKNWEVAKDVYIDGNGTDGERQAFRDGFIDGQRAAAGICPTSAEKRQEGGTDAPETADNVELFNLMNGAAFLPRSERNKHPNAEYFMAQIDPKSRVFPSWEPDKVKSITLTFRKLVTVKDGEIVDITKSGEKVKAVAIEDGGKLFLRVGGSTMDDNIVGVLVRIAISLKGVKE